jgi:hypothetical protein
MWAVAIEHQACTTQRLLRSFVMLRSLLSCAWMLAGCTFTLSCDVMHERGATEPPERDTPAHVRGLDDQATRMLARVPADTPYIWLNAEPLPPAYLEHLAPLADATLAAWDRALAQALTSDDPETAALAQALAGHLTREGLAELGFETNPRLVLYGIGLAPVLRLQLRDATAVARLIERVDAADGELEARSIDGHPVWTAGAAGPLAAAVAVVDDELVITAYPRAVEAELLARAIGSSPPRESLLDTGWLRSARHDHRLLPHGIGMVDLSRVLGLLAGEGDALARAVTQGWAPALRDDRCTVALREWIVRAPRLWLGVREIGGRSIETATIWELDAGLRDDLRGIAAPIAGLGRSDRDEGLASIAIGIDAAAALDVIDALRRDDRLRGCSDEAGTHELEAPAWLAGLHGGSAVLHDWDPRGERVTGAVVLAVDEPLQWLRTILPRADTEALHRRGHAVPLAALLGVPPREWLREAWIARGAHAIGVAAGDGARRKLRRAVGRARDDERTLMSWSLDVQGLLARISPTDLRALLAARGPSERTALEAWLDVIGPVHGALAVGDHGLELTAAVELERR